MFISDSINKLIESYTKSTNADVKTEGKTLMSSLRVNDEIDVTVEKISEDGALVRMSDGSEFTIAGNIPEGTEKGSILTILIKAKFDGMPLQAEVLGASKALNIKIEELKLLLKELGINPSKENLDIINDMNKNGIEINKENISKLFEVISNGSVTKDNAIFMLKNGIEITTESSRAFNSMISKSNFLENNLKVLIDTLTKSINELSKNIDTNVDSADTNSFAMEKIENLTKGISFNNENVSLQNENIEVINNDEVINNNQTVNKEVINIVNNTDSNNEKQVINNVNNVNNFGVENEISSETTNMVIEDIDLPNVEIDENDLKNKQEQIKTQDFEFLVEEPKNAVKSPEEINKNVEITLTKENIKVSDRVNENGTKNITNDNDINDPNFIKLENEELINKELLLADPKVKLDKIKDLRDKVISIFREVKGSKELPEEISLKRIFKSFKDVINELEVSKELFSKDDAENVTKEVTRMRENLELISDLNKYNTVVHIPIQINNNKSIAELYVFNGDRENSRKKINENNATMFLSLGTANMGQVESYIKVVNKTVECKFMTEEKIGSEFINENKEHLVELLAAYGYTLIKASAETYNGESLNIFEAIEKNRKDDIAKGFDAKA